MESDNQSNDTQSYMCFPLSLIEKTHLEAGNNIIMPASALSSRSSQKLVCRMTFRIAKSNSKRTLHHHCGVAEFTADDGFVFLPTWVMKKLNIREGGLVDVKDTSLPDGNYIKVQPHTDEFITVLLDPISVLKKAFRDHYACLTSGDSIVVNHKDNKYLIHIVVTKPSRAISLFENDNYEIEFAKPGDYYKQPRRMRFLEGIREILEQDDDTIYQPMKKKLRYQLSSEANKQQTTFKPFHMQMDNLPDDVIRNILAKLPTKIIVQSRCVSAHWNRLISDSFVKSRLCRKILLVSPDFHAIYTPCVEDVLKLPYSYECQETPGRYIKVIGTFNGIVVLVVNHQKFVDTKPKGFTSHIILYNPLTCESEILPAPYSPFYGDKMHIYGFGYGATKDDLKIVRFGGLTKPEYNWNTCDVFNFKDKSWSTPKILIEDAIFCGDVGTFLNGSLYWCAHSKDKGKKIVTLNVNEMVISEIHLPCTRISTLTYLGTLHGCLWMVTHTENRFTLNMRVMKMEEGVKNSWSESHLTLDLEDKYKDGFQVINLMDDGRILMLGARNVLIIYDASKNSYKRLETPIRIDFRSAKAIDYEESLTSPSII